MTWLLLNPQARSGWQQRLPDQRLPDAPRCAGSWHRLLPCPALGRHVRNSALLGRVPQQYPSQAALSYITLQYLPRGKEDIHIVLPPPQDAPPMEVPLINSWRNAEVVSLFFVLSASQNFPSSHEFNFETQNSQRRSRFSQTFAEKQVSQSTHCVSRTVVHDQLTGSSQAPEGINYNCSILEIQKPLYKS